MRLPLFALLTLTHPMIGGGVAHATDGARLYVDHGTNSSTVTEGDDIVVRIGRDKVPENGSTLLYYTIEVSLDVSEEGSFVPSDQKGRRYVVVPDGRTSNSTHLTIRTIDDDVEEPDGTVTITIHSSDPDFDVDADKQTVTVTILDNDASVAPEIEEVSWISAPNPAHGTYGLGQNITASVTFNQPVTVTGVPNLGFELGGGSVQAAYSGATGGSDNRMSFTYQVARGNEDHDGVRVIADSLVLSGGTIRGADSGLDAVRDHPALGSSDKVDARNPTVSFGAPPTGRIAVGAAHAVFAVFSEPITGFTEGDITVSNGDVVPGSLVKDSGGVNEAWSFQIRPEMEGESLVLLNAGVVEDPVGNGNESSPTYRVQVGTDTPSITIRGGTAAVLEGQGVPFDLTRSHDNGSIPVALRVAFTGDYLAGTTSFGATLADSPAEVSATFPSGQTRTTIRIDTVDDEIIEADGSITVEVQSGGDDGVYSVGQPSSATVAVLSGDEAQWVRIYAERRQVTEGEQVDFIVTRAPDRAGSDQERRVTINVQETGGFLDRTRGLGADLGSDGGAEITFRGRGEAARGPTWVDQRSYTATYFTVYTLGDNLSERSGSITISLDRSTDPYYVVGTPSRATVTVLDDDVGNVTLTAADASVVEGAETVFTVSRVGDVASELRVWVNIHGHTKTMSPATLTLAENRGPGPDVEVVLAAGDASATVRLGTEADNRNEGDGELIVLIVGVYDPPRNSRYVSSERFRIGAPNGARVLVEDDDVPVVSLTSSSLTRSGQSLVGEIVEGTRPEYALTCSGNYEYAQPWVVLLHIEDHLPHPNGYSFFRAREYACGQSNLGQHTRKTYVAGTDGQIRTAILPQTEIAQDGTFNVRRSLGAGFSSGDSFCRDSREFCPKYTVGVPDSVAVRVINRSPIISVEAVENEVEEGQTARFRILRSWASDLLNPHSSAILNDPGYWVTHVNYTSAEEGDYASGALPAGQLVFAVGVTEVFVDVPTASDDVPEAEGSITLSLLKETPATLAQNRAAAYELGAPHSATVRVKSDNTVPVMVANGRALEGAGSIEFEVTLAAASPAATSFDWATSDGTAASGSDFTAANGSLTFAAGDTTKTISVPLLDDDVNEVEETFTVVLSDPVKALLPAEPATGTIEDDDAVKVSIVAKTPTVEEGEPAAFVLTRRGNTAESITGAVRVTESDSDRVRLEAILFREGEQTTTLNINTANDTVVNGAARMIHAAVDPHNNYEIGDPATASVEILDNDERRELQLGREWPATFSAEGQLLLYRYYVRNVGGLATGAPITIEDSLAGTVRCDVDRLPAPTQENPYPTTGWCALYYAVTADDMAAGRVASVAYATDTLVQSEDFVATSVRAGFVGVEICADTATNTTGSNCLASRAVAESAGSVALTVRLSEDAPPPGGDGRLGNRCRECDGGRRLHDRERGADFRRGRADEADQCFRHGRLGGGGHGDLPCRPEVADERRPRGGAGLASDTRR